MKPLILLLLFLPAAVVWDFRKGKIPNQLILTGIISGGFLLLLYNGAGAFLKCLPGMLFPVIVLFPLYRLGVLGAGDIKLFSMLGVYLTFREQLICIVLTFLAGAVISLGVLLWRKNLIERILYFISFCNECICGGHLRSYYLPSQGKEDGSKIHFSLPIMTGVILLFFYKKFF